MTPIVLSAVVVFFSAIPARAERASGASGGPAALSVATGEAIFAAIPFYNQISVRRLAPDGGVVWESRFGRGQGEEATALQAAPEAGVVLAGARGKSCFLVRFDGQGRLMSETTPGGGTGQCRPAAVVTDPNQNAYVLATVSGSDGFDAIVWKFDRGGAQFWSYRYDKPGSVYAMNLYMDPRGDRIIAYVQRGQDGRFFDEFVFLDLDGRRLN